MLTNLKSIARRIDTNNANIVFYDYSIANNQRFSIYFSLLSDEDRVKYETLSEQEKKTYVSNSATIYMPQISIDKFYSDYRYFDPVTVEYTLNMIFSTFPSIKIAPKLYPEAFTLFCILHEIGHWSHFLSCGGTIYKYIDDPVQGKAIFDEQQLLQQEFSQANQITESLKKKALAWTEKYHNIPGEKLADDFARNNFLDAWNILQKHL